MNLLNVVLGLLGLGFLWLVTRKPEKPPLRQFTYQPPREVDFRKKDTASQRSPPTGKKYLVLGVGSVGEAIIDELLARGETHIVAFDIVTPKKYQNDSRVTVVKGSVANSEELKQVFEGVHTVYHTASLITVSRFPHEWKRFYNVNVTGTINVIKACIEANVPYLIYTSTSHVFADRSKHLHSKVELVEDMPYPEHPLNHYVATKSLAEKEILSANGTKHANGNTVLRTASIRPCSGIFGPKDRWLMESAHKTGSYEVINNFIIDWVYVVNVAHGHLCAEKGLMEKPDRVGGQAYLISNNEPLYASEWAARLNYYNPKVKVKNVPFPVAFALAHFSYIVQTLVGSCPWMGDLQLLTPDVFDLHSIDYVSVSNKATLDLGYQPLYTMDESIQHGFEELKKRDKAVLAS